MFWSCWSHSSFSSLSTGFKYLNSSSFTLDLLIKSPDSMTACVISVDRENFKRSFRLTQFAM